MKATRGKRTTLALAAAMTLGGVAGASSADGWEKRNDPMPDFSVVDLAGGELSRDDLRGKVVMIDFWATWCAPCLKELPGLAAWHERLSTEDGVALLSFNVLDEPAVLEKFVKKHDIHFPIYGGDALLEPLEIIGFPTKLIVDMRGEPRILYRRIGYAPAEEVKPKVAEVLAARGGSAPRRER